GARGRARRSPPRRRAPRRPPRARHRARARVPLGRDRPAARRRVPRAGAGCGGGEARAGRCRRRRRVPGVEAMSSSHAAGADERARAESDLPAHVASLVRHEYEAIDPGFGRCLDVLARQGASEIWHKHGTFLGLLHSVYSNSFVRMKVFDSHRSGGRDAVRELIGAEAERLVHLFCEIRREQLLPGVRVKDGAAIPAEGIAVDLYRGGGSVRVSRRDLGVFLVVTMADYAEQHFAWQDRLFANVDGDPTRAGNPHSLWPGDNRPGLWMHLNARLGRLAAACGADPLPPVFARCTADVAPAAERDARDLYWDAIVEASARDDAARAAERLRAACERNPFVAEPHVLLAQAMLNGGRWPEALAEARAALALLASWGTSWDKRLSWEAWVAWSRVLAKAARERSWPDTAIGIVSLGEVRAGA